MPKPICLEWIASLALTAAIGTAGFLLIPSPSLPPAAPPAPLPPVIVAAVLPGSQAAGLDIRPGDRVVSYDGESVRDAAQLRRLAEASEGKAGPLPVVFSRQEIAFTEERGSLIAQRAPRRFTAMAKGGLLGIQVSEDRLLPEGEAP